LEVLGPPGDAASSWYDLFHRNTFLELVRRSASADAGRVRYEMDIARGGDLKSGTP
jgi:hypothetical protein